MGRKSKRMRLRQKILDSLKEKAPLSTDKGEFISTPFKFYSKKDRRNSGREYPRITAPMMKYSEIIEQGLEPKEYWNDWMDYRDGFRDLTHYGCCGDSCEVREEKNKNIKKQIEIRKARKQKSTNTSAAITCCF